MESKARVGGSAGWIVWLTLVSVVSLAPPTNAMVLKIAFENFGDFIIPDPVDDVLRRSTGRNLKKIQISEDPNHVPSRIYFVPTNGASPQDIILRFRLEEIDSSDQGFRTPSDQSFYLSGTNVGSGNPTITAMKWGTGEGDFIEFEITLQNMFLSWGVSHYYRLQPEFNLFTTAWTANFTLDLAAPYEIQDTEVGGAPVDRWFKLVQNVFPDSYSDGGPLPEYISLGQSPLSGKTVQISGENLIFEPTQAQTDSDGVFGVLAFVDPEEFAADAKSSMGAIRDPLEKEKAGKDGTLSLEYENMIRKRGIKGHYCEVIRVEGRVQIVYGSGGSLKVGDILLPGTRLSISANLGERALIGLRFINGSDAEVLQDVYTNACLADLIEIGANGITNLSVLQGNTALMTVSRYLCEKAAGYPNTPEKWAKAVGKMTLKTAASLAVPGSGVTAFAVRYIVKDKVGKVYDRVMTSRESNPKGESPVGDPRVEIGLYYDGSSRIGANFAGAVNLFDATETEPLVGVTANEWLEILDEETLGRTWTEGPDSIDQEGPDLRAGIEIYPDAFITQIDLYATDPAGLDEDAFSVSSQGSPVEGFERRGEGWWSASFFGPPISVPNLTFSVSDRLGNVR
ncbi:MAG: hypothetical protein KC994_23225, partial [Candidatus Omnitrophica bacterium]|nr:hypothetical protein [Candidatus Omnitrophota bacterium]